ncbi:MAG: TRAM domain-containing protein [Simkaniaceae bacterium]|nr:TRAM domain-containing protein [Simkaniaceae bacterium]
MVSRPEYTVGVNVTLGIVAGLILSFVLVGFDTLVRRFNLRSFNIALIGLFLGYLLGLALVILLDAIIDLTSISSYLHLKSIEILKISLFIFGTYLGTIMTLRSSDELYVSIPFVKFTAVAQKKKDLIVDSSALSDSRIIDLCATGILDFHLIIPRFIIKELYAQSEIGEESIKFRARRSLETVKKMELNTSLGVRFNDTDFPEAKDQTSKLIRLSRLIDANILTADLSRVQMSSIEGVKVINIHALSNALKPLMDSGEYISIKIQRLGKEPRQGVGYLEDGTMVVVNGGGSYIGETIEVQVLSVKHTSSGRMIFCNALDEIDYVDSYEEDEHDK